MKIGVLGPPGVGKTKFARALAKEFNLKVVDNYIQKLQRDTNLALGPWSSYGELYMVAGVRMATEFKYEDRITVGTIMDSITYAAVHSDVAMQRTEEHRRAMYVTAQGAMQGFAMWSQEAYDYHLSFHLPYSKEEIASRGSTWEVAVDSAYPLVIDSFNPPFTYTLTGSHKNRIDVAKEVIELAQRKSSNEETETSEVVK